MKKSKKCEQRIQNQFGAFCARVLKNETRYIQRELSNKAVKEKSLAELSKKGLYELSVYDEYFNDQHCFDVRGKGIVVKGDMLVVIIEKLPTDKRDIILLSYFMDMTDREIAIELDTVRQNVSKRLAHIRKLMRSYLEKGV